MNIGNLIFGYGIFLAPMAGITDQACRVIARKAGCEMAFSEMVSSEGLVRNGARTRKYLKIHEDERPVGIQIFGADPGVMAQAASIVQDSGADLLDINMGCPVKKVTRTGAGSALMKEPLKAAAVIRNVRKAVSIPLTVKMRAGWRGDLNCLEVGMIAESEGADAVILHPRTVEQGFTGRADWTLIALMKSSLKIPVIGNGDIRSAADAGEMRICSGCDGVMVGRGALGNPWLFRSIGENCAGSSPGPAPTPEEKKEIALLHLDLAVSVFGEESGIREFRSHLCWYARGYRGAVTFRNSVSSLNEAHRLREMICSFFNGLEKQGAQGIFQ